MVQIMKGGGYHGRVGFFLFATPALGFLFTLFECLGTSSIIVISGSGPAISGSSSSLASGGGCRGCHRSTRSFVSRTAIFRVVFIINLGGLLPDDGGNGSSSTYLLPLLIMLEQSWCWRRRAWMLVSGCLTCKKTKTKEISIIIYYLWYFFLFQVIGLSSTRSNYGVIL